MSDQGLYSDESYRKGQDATRQYHELLTSCLRSDFQALVDQGRFDNLLRERIDKLIADGEFDRRLKKRAVSGASGRNVTASSRGRQVSFPRRNWVLVGGSLLLIAAVVLAAGVFRRPQTDLVATDPTPVQADSRSLGSNEPVQPPPPSPRTAQELIQLFDQKFANEPRWFEPLTTVLRSDATDAVQSMVEQWLRGESANVDRIRRAMVQVVLRERDEDPGRIDGAYGRGCSGKTCPLLKLQWRNEDGLDGVPSYPRDLAAWSERPFQLLERYEKTLIARFVISLER